MFQDISGEFKLNIWHQVFPWYHEKYMKWRYPSLGDMKKNRASIKAAVEKELERRLESDTDEDDLLQYIIKTHSMKNTASSVESLTTYIQIMFFVGVLTTVGSTIALIQVVANDPSLIKQLLEEQEKAIDDEIEAQQLQNDDMDRNAFLVKNAAHIYRRLAKLDSLLREGFRQTKVETDQMEEFKPFRFVDRQAPSTKVGSDFLLFGMGKHACPGRWFAIHQMKGVITCLIRNYEITALKSGGIELTKRCPGNVKLDIV
ncbi:hypothetical protein [Absidia glauca]|uniref:Cytochrome P450 n=1 Tax=Absidia glauca TaxID=4829 RepID=A0A163JFW2_ABSGL|nr:hypothetical protein [Absidia glauca]